ncbi:MAG: hypothetical protein ACT4SY_10725 [Hyphomicrobiales bacterium]
MTMLATLAVQEGDSAMRASVLPRKRADNLYGSFESGAGRSSGVKVFATGFVDAGGMVKSYYHMRTRPAGPDKGVRQGFVLGLADFACLGWQVYDLAGYPYESEDAALFSDWMKLGQDFENASRKIEEERR